MRNKLIKKYYIFKLFSFSLPKSKIINKNSYYLCKFILKETPYGNMNIFFKELQKILFINKNMLLNKKILFICCNKIFYKNINIHQNFFKPNKINKKTNSYELNNKKITFSILCDSSYTSKQISFLKDKKILTIGFLNFNRLPQITDFTVLLESKYFASIFLFNYIINKLITNGFN